MMEAPQMTFGFAAEAEAVMILPAPLIGEADVKRLQTEGWRFESHGIRLKNCYTCWALKGEEWKTFFLADPEIYPDSWSRG